MMLLPQESLPAWAGILHTARFHDETDIANFFSPLIGTKKACIDAGLGIGRELLRGSRYDLWKQEFHRISHRQGGRTLVLQQPTRPCEQAGFEPVAGIIEALNDNLVASEDNPIGVCPDTVIPPRSNQERHLMNCFAERLSAR